MSDQQSGLPRSVEVEGVAVEIREMQTDDAEALLAFVRSVPRHDLMFLPTDITEIEGLNGWVNDLLTGVTRVILAVGPSGVVGFSSVVRAPTSWTRHVAELRVVVGQAVRGSGLGRQLVAEAFRAAARIGVQRMNAQMTLDQQGAISVFRKLGFAPLAVLPEQVIDEDGSMLDLLVMHQDVESFESTLARLG